MRLNIALEANYRSRFVYFFNEIITVILIFLIGKQTSLVVWQHSVDGGQ